MQINPVARVRPAISQTVILLLAGALVGIGGATIVSLTRESRYIKALDEERAHNVAALNEARDRIQALSARLDSLLPPKPSRRTVTHAAPTPSRRGRKPAIAKPEDERFARLQSQLSEHQKALADTREEIASTRDEVAKTRDDLQGKLDSTRGELNASIAKNHDELVVLQKRGERNYHEFDLRKSKEFQTVGPLSLSLRKADTKHKRYNVAMLVADYRLEKKNVNLYEPIWINLNDRPQPVQLIVNQINKDEIRGYVSEPRYKQSELAENSSEREPKSQLLRR